jgi:hypothetical protein
MLSFHNFAHDLSFVLLYDIYGLAMTRYRLRSLTAHKHFFSMYI